MCRDALNPDNKYTEYIRQHKRDYCSRPNTVWYFVILLAQHNILNYNFFGDERVVITLEPSLQLLCNIFNALTVEIYELQFVFVGAADNLCSVFIVL